MAANLRGVAAELHAARAEARRLAATVDPPASVAEAYDVQAELIRLGGGVRGWKVTALTPESQAKFGSAVPVAGALLHGHVHAGPCELRLDRAIAPLIECEIAFVLGADLPRRPTPYTRPEVEDAIAAAVPAFEFPDGRVPHEAPELLKLADVMANGGLVFGERREDWRSLDLTREGIDLFLDGRPLASGTGGAVPGGDPVAAVLALANAQPLPAGLLAGQIVTTGTCTPPLSVQPGSYEARFGTLGSLRVRFV